MRFGATLFLLALVVCVATAFTTPFFGSQESTQLEVSPLLTSYVEDLDIIRAQFNDSFGLEGAEVVRVSPFTMNSTFIEILVSNLPFTADKNDTKYEYVVDTTGFKAHKNINIRTIEFNATSTHETATTVTFENKASAHFSFKAKFGKFPETTPGYHRAILMGFDIKEWIEAPKFKITSRSISTSGEAVEFAPITPGPFANLGGLDVAFEYSWDKHKKVNFTFTVDHLVESLSAADQTLKLYSYYPAYKLIPAEESKLQFECVVNNQTKLPAQIYPATADYEAFLAINLAPLTTTIPANGKATFACDGAQIDVTQKLHSRFWIAYTDKKNAHAIQYEAGTDRKDVQNAIVLIIVLAIIGVIVALTVIGCIIKCICCGKRKQDGGNINGDNAYYRM